MSHNGNGQGHSHEKAMCQTSTCAPAAEAPAQTAYVPRVDILENPTSIQLVVDLPGVADDGVEVTLEKNILTIRGQVQPHAPEGYEVVAAEYPVGRFERAFTIPDGVERSDIQANLQHGVLRLTLPKAKQHLTTRIPVTAS